MQPPRQPEHPLQAPGGRTRAIRDQPRIDVAAVPQHEGHRYTHGGQRQRQQQDPPAIAGVGTDLLHPADRRQPGQPRSLGDVGDRADRIRQRDGQQREPPRRPGAGGHLRADARHGGECDAGERPAQPEGERTGDGQTCRDERDCAEQAQRQTRAGGHHQCCRQRSAATQHAGCHEFQAPGLLVGAGVANDHEHHQHRRQGRPERGEFEQRQLP